MGKVGREYEVSHDLELEEYFDASRKQILTLPKHLESSILRDARRTQMEIMNTSVPAIQDQSRVFSAISRIPEISIIRGLLVLSTILGIGFGYANATTLEDLFYSIIVPLPYFDLEGIYLGVDQIVIPE